MSGKRTSQNHSADTNIQANTPQYRTPAVRREDAAVYEKVRARKRRSSSPSPAEFGQSIKPVDTGGYRPPVQLEREKQNKSPQSGRAVMIALLACAAMIAIVLGVRFYDYWQAQREYAQYVQYATENMKAEAAESELPPQASPAPSAVRAAGAVQSAAPSVAPVVTPKPFFSETVQGFAKENGDAVAYLDIPGTQIQYPVVQSKDNEYYVTHTFAKKRRAAGAIFADAWNSSDFSDFNTVLYGHNMKDGSMFSGLREYRHASFWRDHKNIEVTLLNSKRIYRVFAAYLVEDSFDFRGFTHHSQGSRIGFVRDVASRSEVKTNTEARGSDTLLTLVTCATEERDWYWVVHAMLTEEITTMP